MIDNDNNRTRPNSDKEKNTVVDAQEPDPTQPRPDLVHNTTWSACAPLLIANVSRICVGGLPVVVHTLDDPRTVTIERLPWMLNTILH